MIMETTLEYGFFMGSQLFVHLLPLYTQNAVHEMNALCIITMQSGDETVSEEITTRVYSRHDQQAGVSCDAERSLVAAAETEKVAPEPVEQALKVAST
jgi:hypothetical protein